MSQATLPTQRALDAVDCRPALAGTACRTYGKHFAQRGFEFFPLPNRIHVRPSAVLRERQPLVRFHVRSSVKSS